jgi:hypothetical protein
MYYYPKGLQAKGIFRIFVASNKTNKDMEKERIIVKKTLDGFSATTESNYKAMISDARKVWKFRESEGFKEFSDVKEYIRKWFHTEDVVLEE